MAVRRKRGGYEVYYRDPATGKQRGRYFRIKADAEREDRRIRYLLEFERSRLLDEDADRVGARDAKVEPEPEPVEDAAERYRLRSVAQRFVALRYAEKGTCRYAFQRIAGLYGDLDVRAMGPDAMFRICQDGMDRGLKPQTVRLLAGRVRTLLNFAKDLGYISEIPKAPKLPRNVPHVFQPPTDEELRRIYEAAAPHLKRVVVLGAIFGMRVGRCELLSLRWSDVDLENWVVNLRSAKKNPKAPVRKIPIVGGYRKMLAEWKEADGDAEFVVSYRGRAVRQINYAWATAVRKAGIGRRLRPYDLRHAFATSLLEKGADIGVVANLMGHSNASMILRHYQFVRESHKEAALGKLNGLF